MILGASGENIYPEEIESIINNFRFVNESLVVESKGKLVAMVHFNMEELEKQYQKLNPGRKLQSVYQRLHRRTEKRTFRIRQQPGQ